MSLKITVRFFMDVPLRDRFRIRSAFLLTMSSRFVISKTPRLLRSLLLGVVEIVPFWTGYLCPLPSERNLLNVESVRLPSFPSSPSSPSYDVVTLDRHTWPVGHKITGSLFTNTVCDSSFKCVSPGPAVYCGWTCIIEVYSWHLFASVHS